MKKRILGIDTGTNSLGWAVVDQNNDKTTLVKRGTLIFEESVNIDKGIITSSKAAVRTAYRLQRRQHFRRRLRKIETLKVLIENNFCPAITKEDLKLWQTRKIYPLKNEFMLWQRTKDKEDKNPYHDRYICLTEKLDFRKEADRFTFGRAIYHLAQRRGFKSNRLEDDENDAETGKVKESIANLTKEIQAAGCQYLGEYFYKLYKENKNNVRIRARYIERDGHYINEFKAICAKQNIPDELQNKLYNALYFIHDGVKQKVGKCTYEKNKKRCPESHPLFEEFRKQKFINNIRIKGPDDIWFRLLNKTELEKIDSLFYRKTKSKFDFEEIAKSIAGKKNYRSESDSDNNEKYVFNYRMTQTVSGCPFTTQLREVFGKDWKHAIVNSYTNNTKKDGTPKTEDEIINDIWNVLFFSMRFAERFEKLKEFAKSKLQLNEQNAEKFSKIKISRNYSSLSIKAISNILPFLREGSIEAHATIKANIPNIVGQQIWNDETKRNRINQEVSDILSTPRSEIKRMEDRCDYRIKQLLIDNYSVSAEDAEKLYHPSIVNYYPDARPNKNGVILLGDPKTDSLRNPMVMRSMYKIRKVVNTLILEGIVSPSTDVHIEYSRELNSINKRRAIYTEQNFRKKENEKYREEIKTLYKEACGKNIEPNDVDILKYRLWLEQDRKSIYTGAEIKICDFIGPNPKFDIEHTIARSSGGDSTMENLTLCEIEFNRFKKKSKLPCELDNYKDILERIEPWKERFENLTKTIDKLKKRHSTDKNTNDKRIQKIYCLEMERDYWKNKYQRFTMTEVPEGFARRQKDGNAIISKYVNAYLKTYFHNAANPDKKQIYTIKGSITAEFRKMWGLQKEFEEKSRDNYAHHCVDAIVVACIGKQQYDSLAKWYKAQEEFDRGERSNIPEFKKPWPTFTEDVKELYDKLLIVHDTKDNAFNRTKKWVKTSTGKHLATGDSVRRSLHKETFYGAIKRNGEVCYVKRIALDDLKDENIKDIVDDAVRAAVQEAANHIGLKKAVKEGIFLGGKTPIKKVRCTVKDVPVDIRKQRDKGPKDYKNSYHAMTGNNYCIGIYEGTVNGNVERDFELVSVFDAAKKTKKHEEILPAEKNGLHLIYNLKKGQHVLLLDKEESRDEVPVNPEKRLYVVSGISPNNPKGGKYHYGNLSLKLSQEARHNGKELTKKKGVYINGETIRSVIGLNHKQIHALVENVDFIISPLGDITYINKFKKKNI